MWEILGHQRAVERLAREVRDDRLPHALLLTGPAGIGKTSLALTLAKALNCSDQNPPCGECRECRQIDAASHPDVTLLGRLEGKDSIQIQQIRELRETASLRPFQGLWKVYVIIGGEDLTPQASDALLKTLEEPQPQVKIVLTAVDAEALPETVVSRCGVIQLQRPSREEIAGFLAGRGRNAEEAERIAILSRGNVGWAIRAAEQPKLVAQQESLLEKLAGIPDLGLEARLELAEHLASERKDKSSVRRHLELLMLLARDLLFIRQDLPPSIVTGAQEVALKGQADRLGLAAIQGYADRIREAMDRIEQNVDARLTLEALLLSLP